MSLAVVCAAEHALGRGTSETVQIESVNYQQQERTEAAGCRSKNPPFCSLELPVTPDLRFLKSDEECYCLWLSCWH